MPQTIFSSETHEITDSTNPFDSVVKSELDMINSEDDKLDEYGAQFGGESSNKDSDDDKNCLRQSQFPPCLRNSSSGSGGSLSQSPNQTNLGTTIAGVVEGGASKLQALHKWFKGDSFDGRDFSKRKNELSELASVSVRDLVKAIGGQESKSNGNELTPPMRSRSSSPVAVPIGMQYLFILD